MDILNFISWIRGKRQVTTVDPAKTLIPIGLKDGRRDDEYLAGAITVQDLAAQIAPQPTYKVYTALLTQSGGDDQQTITSGALQIGVSYTISIPLGEEPTYDFSNVGGPISPDNFSFVSISSDIPNNYGNATLSYNTGTPVVTVLENTIGNISFTYNSTGSYTLNLSNSIDIDKTFLYIGNGPTVNQLIYFEEAGIKTITFPGLSGSSSTIYIYTTTDGFGGSLIDDKLISTPIEIRVYN